jgi:glycerophosphoryl diester phosphodiesterase
VLKTPGGWKIYSKLYMGDIVAPAATAAATSLRVGAHRGAMGYAPENTAKAFQIAIYQGD